MGLFDLFRKKLPKQEVPKAEPSSKPAEHIQITATIGTNNEIPSLHDLVAAATPSKQGLYPHEILMLNYASTYKTSGNTFQGFWLYEYGVNNPQTVLESLLDRGFITIGGIKDTLQRQTVSTLKKELSRIGAKTTGKKETLIERILELEDTATLEAQFPDKYFVPTEKGVREISDNEYVLYLHRKRYMSVWEMNKLLNANGPRHLPYRDILWGEFNRQSLEHITNLDFGLYRNTRLSMYEFLMEENRYRDAFSCLCEVLYCDFSGLGNSETLFFSNDAKAHRFSLGLKLESCFPYEKSIVKIAPGIKENLIDLQKKLGLDNANLENALRTEFEGYSFLPYHVFTVAECVEIVMGEINNQTEQVERIYQIAEDRMKKEYNSIK